MSIISTNFKPGDDKTWDRIFTRHRQIEEIQIEEDLEGAQYLTVYEFDSDDPVPYSELRGRIKTDIDECWDLYDQSLTVNS